jgi:hypothetical protein
MEVFIGRQVQLMAQNSLAEMTADDLRQFVEEVVERRLEEWWKPRDPRSVRELNAAIRKLRWTPPPDVPSNMEIIRQDRES